VTGLLEETVPPGSGPQDPAGGGWTGALRRRLVDALPPERLLPDTQPAYVSSWIYVFGVLTLTAFLTVVGTGTVLALKGASWWHASATGHFVNSLHLWSVELLMTFMAIHLIAKFFMAAWRGRRIMTWITGVLALGVSAFTALTGYLVQQNFDAQWIATQAKDGLNAIGVGAYFDTMDFGQMLIWHVTLLPGLAGLIVVLHILLVRRRGVVPPIAPRSDGLAAESAGNGLQTVGEEA
jgi:quinol-cytochrome oxidoreductase complex cytochrome b subunit